MLDTPPGHRQEDEALSQEEERLSGRQSLSYGGSRSSQVVAKHPDVLTSHGFPQDLLNDLSSGAGAPETLGQRLFSQQTTQEESDPEVGQRESEEVQFGIQAWAQQGEEDYESSVEDLVNSQTKLDVAQNHLSEQPAQESQEAQGADKTQQQLPVQETPEMEAHGTLSGQQREDKDLKQEEVRHSESQSTGTDSTRPSQQAAETPGTSMTDRLPKGLFPSEAPGQAEMEDEGLRVLFQAGTLTAETSQSGMSVQTTKMDASLDDVKQIHDRAREQLMKELWAESGEEYYESSVEEVEKSQTQSQVGQNHLSNKTAKQREAQGDDAKQQQLQFQELLEDLQKENDNLRSLCMTLTREKTHLARTVLEMRDQVKSTSQENLTLKLHLEALREDKRRSTDRGAIVRHFQDMTAAETAQIAEQEVGKLIEEFGGFIYRITDTRE
ncbi:tropomyosin-2-like [Heterodontus francisci]|uniref:tropomyosin-2-like n=1 Tax=Heterodontus francisci TaxID=7792 RepID=UPI00355B4493